MMIGNNKKNRKIKTTTDILSFIMSISVDYRNAYGARAHFCMAADRCCIDQAAVRSGWDRHLLDENEMRAHTKHVVIWKMMRINSQTDNINTKIMIYLNDA